jgi:hypothetical protein
MEALPARKQMFKNMFSLQSNASVSHLCAEWCQSMTRIQNIVRLWCSQTQMEACCHTGNTYNLCSLALQTGCNTENINLTGDLTWWTLPRIDTNIDLSPERMPDWIETESLAVVSKELKTLSYTLLKNYSNGIVLILTPNLSTAYSLYFSRPLCCVLDSVSWKLWP